MIGFWDHKLWALQQPASVQDVPQFNIFLQETKKRLVRKWQLEMIIWKKRENEKLLLCGRDEQFSSRHSASNTCLGFFWRLFIFFCFYFVNMHVFLLLTIYSFAHFEQRFFFSTGFPHKSPQRDNEVCRIINIWCLLHIVFYCIAKLWSGFDFCCIKPAADLQVLVHFSCRCAWI